MTFDPAHFRTVLEQEGLTGPTGQNSRSLIFKCFQAGCGSKLVVEKTTGHFVCFNCRYRNRMFGPAEMFLAKALGISADAARTKLYGTEGAPMRMYLPPLVWVEEDDTEEEILEELVWDYHHLSIDDPRAERGAAYLEGRGIPISVAKEYQIRYSPVDRRVCFPVYEDGKLRGWQGRLIIPTDKKALKILSSPRIPRERVLMFQDRVVGDHAVLFEGPVDAIKGHLCGGNVASMGAIVGPGQIDVLRRKKVRRLYLGQDPDAVQETVRLTRKYGAEFECYRLEIPKKYKDAGDMTMEEVQDVFRSAPRIYPWQLYYHFRGISI